MEVVMNMMKMLKKSQEDELRDNMDDIREEEGRRQENSDIHCENEGQFCSGNNTKWNEEDDQLGGDLNDQIGVEGNKMAGWKFENELEKETAMEDYVIYNNQYNDMKIDKDCFDKLSRGKISGEDDDPLNPVNLKGLLHVIKMAFEKQSSESSGEFNRARVGRVPTAYENDRKQAVVHEAETLNELTVHLCYMQRCMLQEAMKARLRRQHKLSIDSFPIEECMTCIQQPNAHDCGIYIMCFMKNLKQSREAGPVQVHSISHLNDISIRLFFDDSNLARDWILKAF
ncbi:hypothetical protein M9H77_30699 [Catharanthus roseus]|uniref:Uncharacterized protein n=1 Tax=Catharanthus roseus TaxID=4058 RepID=A0ACB9ZZB5_CATRO|nr:hypothetical protein M9H77_30699 [Catharanthus roseus]